MAELLKRAIFHLAVLAMIVALAYGCSQAMTPEWNPTVHPDWVEYKEITQ